MKTNMKLIMEGWRRHINEADEPQMQQAQQQQGQINSETLTPEQLFERVKEIVANNPFLSKELESLTQQAIVVNKDSIYINFPNNLQSDHIKKHFPGGTAGSKWSIPEASVKQIILDKVKAGLPAPVVENKATKFKWLNQQADKIIGFDNIVKITDKNKSMVKKAISRDPFAFISNPKATWEKVVEIANAQKYKLVNDDNSPYTEKDFSTRKPAFTSMEINEIPGDEKSSPTKFYNLVLVQLSENEQNIVLNGKPLLSLMTIFPGYQVMDSNGKDLSNKELVSQAGYAFVKSPESQIKETLKRNIRTLIYEVLQEQTLQSKFGLGHKFTSEELIIAAENALKNGLNRGDSKELETLLRSRLNKAGRTETPDVIQKLKGLLTQVMKAGGASYRAGKRDQRADFQQRKRDERDNRIAAQQTASSRFGSTGGW